MSYILREELRGGEFGHGFIAAGLPKAINMVPGVNKLTSYGIDVEKGETGGTWGKIVRTSAAATIGGTVSELTGGKFGNGAVTASFSWLLNTELSNELNNGGSGQCQSAEDCGFAPNNGVAEPSWGVLELLVGGAGVVSRQLGRGIGGFLSRAFFRGATKGDSVLRPGWKNWGKYMGNKGWTPDEIQQTLIKGKWKPHLGTNHMNPGNPMRLVTNPYTGKSLIIDNVTREIIQLGRKGYRY